MNKHSIALLVILLLVGTAMFALVDYQHGRALPPVGSAQPAKGGGLVINGISIQPPATASDAASGAASGAAAGESAAGAAASPTVPEATHAAAEGSGATCP